MNRLERGALFLSSFAIFGMLVLLSPTLSTFLHGEQLIIVNTAPFLAMFAAYLFSNFKIRIKSQRVFSLLALTLPLTFLILKILFEDLTLRVLEEIPHIPTHDLIFFRNALLPIYEKTILLTMGTIALPFALYGFAVGKLIEEKKELFLSILKYECLGAVGGAVLVALLLDFGSWSFALLSILAAAGIPLLWIYRTKASLLCIVVSLFSPFYLEPETGLALSARDYKKEFQVSEERRSWNTFSKVQTLYLAKNSEITKRVVSIGEGLGHARLKTTPGSYALEFVSVFEPKKSLLLFAGAGSELFVLNDLVPSAEKIVGVEINPAVIAHGQKEPSFPINKLLENPHIQLVNQDARVYLNSVKDPFDLIFFSQAGSSRSQFYGALIHTTQFALTAESFLKAFNSLSNDGLLVIEEGSKSRFFRQLQKALPALSLPNHAVIIDSEMGPPSQTISDNDVLIIKKSPFSEEDLAKLQAETAKVGRQLVVKPGHCQKNYEFYCDPSQTRSDLNLATDDKPFPYRMDEKNSWLLKTKNELAHLISSGSIQNYFQLGLILLLLSGMVFAALAIFIAKAEGAQATSTFSGIFVSGVHSLLLQIYSIYVFIFYIGNPTWALILGFGSVLAGQLICLHLQPKSWGTRYLKMSALGAPLALLLFHYGVGFSSHQLFLDSVFLRGSVLMIVMSLLNSFFSSTFISLSKFASQTMNTKVLKIALGMDCLISAVASLFSVYLAEKFGISAMVKTAIIFYLLTLTLGIPAFRSLKKSS